MPKSLAMLALLTGLTGFVAPSPAFAQACNQAIATGFLYSCPPPVSSFFYDRQGFRHFRGDNGFHNDRGYRNGGAEDFNQGSGHGEGMGHGGGGGHGR
jgi:hypothetical protein